MSNDTDYAGAMDQARQKLNVSIKVLAERMADLGYDITASRLEDMIYRPRRLNVRGRTRLQQISEAFQAIATDQGKSPDRYLPHRLWPDHFEKPAAHKSK